MNINNNHKCIIFICICFVFFIYHVGIKLGRQLSFFSLCIFALYLVNSEYWALIKAPSISVNIMLLGKSFYKS